MTYMSCIRQSAEDQYSTFEKVLLAAYKELVATEPLTQGRSVKFHCQDLFLSLFSLVNQYFRCSTEGHCTKACTVYLSS